MRDLYVFPSTLNCLRTSIIHPKLSEGYLYLKNTCEIVFVELNFNDFQINCCGFQTNVLFGVSTFSQTNVSNLFPRDIKYV